MSHSVFEARIPFWLALEAGQLDGVSSVDYAGRSWRRCEPGEYDPEAISAVIQRCIGCVEDSEGKVFLFQAHRHMDALAFPDDPAVRRAVREAKREAYPAIEAPLFEGTEDYPILSELGYGLYREGSNTYRSYPSPDRINRVWARMRDEQPSLPEFRACWSEGIATDEGFSRAIAEHDVIVSNEREFLHDQDAHARRLAHYASQFPEQYKAFRAELTHQILAISTKLEKREKAGNWTQKYLEEMRLILGLLVDIRISQFGPESPLTLGDEFVFDFRGMSNVEFWRKRRGEYPDVDRLEISWRELVRSSLGSDEFTGALESGPKQGTILYSAVWAGHVEFVRFLVGKRGGVHGPWAQDWCLRWEFGAPLTVCAAEANQPECLQLLLDSGAEVDQMSLPSGFTALYKAALEGHQECVRLLLENGADPDQDCLPAQVTPLFAAAWKGQLGCLELLLKHGGSPLKPCEHGQSSPMKVAERMGHEACVEAMKRHLAESKVAELA